MPNQKTAIAEIIELLGKKWMMRIIWELRSDALTFRELQAHCGGLSPTVLNSRLKQLQQAQLLQRDEVRGYSLTVIGMELLALYEPLSEWADAWQQQRQPSGT